MHKDILFFTRNKDYGNDIPYVSEIEAILNCDVDSYVRLVASKEDINKDNNGSKIINETINDAVIYLANILGRDVSVADEELYIQNPQQVIKEVLGDKLNDVLRLMDKYHTALHNIHLSAKDYVDYIVRLRCFMNNDYDIYIMTEEDDRYKSIVPFNEWILGLVNESGPLVLYLQAVYDYKL